MLQIFFAILAGILTVGAPCILPLLPILLGSSIGQSKDRPIFIALGFTITFAIAGLTLSWLTTHADLDPNSLRQGAIILLALFGFFMLWPKPFELITAKFSGLLTKASQFSQQNQNGKLGGLLLGVILGVVWTPCAGPVLGSILTLVATQNDLVQSAILLLAYSLGAAIPMLVIAYGGQIAAQKVRSILPYTTIIQQVFGGLILIVAILMFFGLDTVLQAKLLEHYNFTSLETIFIKTNQ